MSHLPEPVSEQDIMEMFSFADKDRDGKISYDEFLIMITPVKVLHLLLLFLLHFLLLLFFCAPPLQSSIYCWRCLLSQEGAMKEFSTQGTFKLVLTMLARTDRSHERTLYPGYF